MYRLHICTYKYVYLYINIMKRVLVLVEDPRPYQRGYIFMPAWPGTPGRWCVRVRAQTRTSLPGFKVQSP